MAVAPWPASPGRKRAVSAKQEAYLAAGALEHLAKRHGPVVIWRRPDETRNFAAAFPASGDIQAWTNPSARGLTPCLRRPKSFISRSERTSVRSLADPRSRMSGNCPALDGACSCFRIFPIAALQHVATSPVGKIKKSLRLLILSSLPPASSACVGQQDQFALVRLSHFAFPRRRTSFASDGATGQTFTDLAALIRAALATSLP